VCLNIFNRKEMWERRGTGINIEGAIKALPIPKEGGKCSRKSM
jgi:hypothetical protein